MQLLKQSTAVTVKIGPFLDDSDGKTAETGLTITQAEVRLSKNGGDIAQKNESTSCTHDELGIYGCPLDATDTGTLGRLQLWVHESGALPVWHEYMVVTANVYDTLCSTDAFDVNVASLDDIDLSATMKTSVNAEVDTALNTAIPGSPTANSVNERVKAIDDKLPTNYLMGSSVVTDKDDEIDAIKTAVEHGTYGLSALETLVDEVESLLKNATYGLSALRTQGDAAWITATGFSTHAAADVWAVGTRALTDKAGFSLSAAGIDSIVDEVMEGSTTLRQAIRLVLSALAAKSSGGGTNTLVFRDIGDSKARITATVDADGNRTAMTLDGT